MQIKVSAIVFAMLLVLVQVHSAIAWNAAGHKTIAEIAWQKLDPPSRAVIVAALKKHPRFHDDFEHRLRQEVGRQDTTVQDHWIFCHAAIWPDLARSQPEFHRASWHYINLPVFLTTDDATAFGGQLPVNVNFEPSATPDEKKFNAVQAVKKSLSALDDPVSSEEELAVRFCWLMHVIPDVAQPLHSAALFSTDVFPRGDQGGNKILIRAEGSSGSGKKLHAVWDGLLGTDAKFNAIRTKADELIQAHQSDFNSSFIALPNDVWTTESQQLAVTWAYQPLLDDVRNAEDNGGRLGTIEVPGSYFEDAGAVAGQQAVISGVRLAGVLQQVVQQNTAPPVAGGTKLGFPAVVAQRQKPASAAVHRRLAAPQSGSPSSSEEEHLAARVAALEAEVAVLRSLLGRRASPVSVSDRRARVAAAIAATPEDEADQCSCEDE